MMKKLILGILSLFLIAPVFAQLSSASLQASGLTCAMCAKSVYKNLESLPFVDSIDTDLDKSAFLIKFKPGTDVDADAIKKKVEDAGFSVAGLSLTARFEGQALQPDQHLTIAGATYHFIGNLPENIRGEHQFSLVDKGFLSPRDLRKYADASKSECFKTGHAGPCCSEQGVQGNARVYHVKM